MDEFKISPEDLMAELPAAKPRPRGRPKSSIASAFPPAAFDSGDPDSNDLSLAAALQQAADPPPALQELPEGDRARLILREHDLGDRFNKKRWYEEYTPAHCQVCGFNVLTSVVRRRMGIDMDDNLLRWKFDKQIKEEQGKLLKQYWDSMNDQQRRLAAQAVDQHIALQHGRQASRIIFADELEN